MNEFCIRNNISSIKLLINLIFLLTSFVKNKSFLKQFSLNVEMISIDANILLNSFNNNNNSTNTTTLIISMLNSFRFIKIFKN